ncbi:TIGR03086 family metal-binding protein [Flindersiella endophytica]
MSVLESYGRSQDVLDRVLATVPSDGWEKASECPGWTVRDVAGHVIWGQHALGHWATERVYQNTVGAPGSIHPAEMAGDDPLDNWRAARAATAGTLTGAALRTVVVPAQVEIPLVGVVTAYVTDTLVHAWDIGHSFVPTLRLDDELVAESFDWARRYAPRTPGFFGPELQPQQGADLQTRWLAFLGRAA